MELNDNEEQRQRQVVEEEVLMSTKQFFAITQNLHEASSINAKA
jgi:hypothetical protein